MLKFAVTIYYYYYFFFELTWFSSWSQSATQRLIITVVLLTKDYYRVLSINDWEMLLSFCDTLFCVRFCDTTSASTLIGTFSNDNGDRTSLRQTTNIK